MKTAQSTKVDGILAGLMRRYTERVPDVARILRALEDDGLVAPGAAVENDHIAFRTLGVPHLGIASLEKIFLHCGYVRRDPYHFAQKRLDAFWYAPPQPQYPRIFISELRVGDLSAAAQEIIASYTAAITQDPVDALDLDDVDAVDAFLHSALWRLPTYADYARLGEESEYAAWVIYNRYYLNHFTIAVHALAGGYDDLERFNGYLLQHGITLNDAGGLIKCSPDGLLRQSSTVAERVLARFADGEEHLIPGSYVEFAERAVLEPFRHLPPASLTRAHRREGFEAGNADKIFESTYRAQVEKRVASGPT